MVAVAAFLRVINALENIRESIELLEKSRKRGASRDRSRLLKRRATFETEDAIQVLAGAGLHPSAVAHLELARQKTLHALDAWWSGNRKIRKAVAELREARARLVAPPASGLAQHGSDAGGS